MQNLSVSADFAPQTRIKRSLFVVKGTTLLALLLVGGFITLMEVTNRATLVGEFSIDGLRNLLLLATALLFILLSTLTNKLRLPAIQIVWPYLLFLLWALLSLTWSTHIFYSLRDAMNLIYPLLIFILAKMYLHSAEQRVAIMRTIYHILTFFAVVTLISSLIFILSKMTSGAWQWGVTRLLSVPFVMSPVVAPTYIAFELAFWRKLPGWQPKWHLVGSIIVYLFLTLTRSYIIALALVCIIPFWATRRKIVWQMIGRLALVTVSVLLIFALFTIDNPVKQRMFWNPDEVTLEFLLQTLLTNPRLLLSEEFVKFSGRFAYWEHLLQTAHELRPAILGAGLGTSRIIMIESRFTATVAHSDFVKFLAELGYIGLGLFLLIYVLLFWWSTRAALDQRLSPIARAAAVILLAQGVLGMVNGLVYNPFVHVHTLHTIAFILIAVIHSELQKRKEIRKLDLLTLARVG